MTRLKAAGLVEILIRGGNGSGRKSNLYHLVLRKQIEVLGIVQPDDASGSANRTTSQEQKDNWVEQEVIESPEAKGKPKVKPKSDTGKSSNEEVLPENLNFEAWIRYEKYLKESGYRRLTKEGRKLSQQKLAALRQEVQSQVVDDSIANGWKGLFPEKYGDKQSEANETSCGRPFGESFDTINARNRQAAGLD